MSSVFLKRVELSNFRVYGESYVFELPDRPSVTLITGANGLGKTSFFDGIEWALTGQVSRFQDIKTDGRRREIDPLTRIGTAADGHRVSLKFTDGPTIDRGGGYEVDEARLIELLKRDTWPFISNLHGYLSITHFLGQASTRRFSLREPRNQWEALKGPAGVDRINSLREKLCGQGARQAFTRAIRERAQSLQAATDKLEEWNRLKIECARLSLLATSERSISPERVLADAEQLVERLRAMGTDVASDLNVTAMNPEVMLAQVGEVLGRIEALNERDAVRIRELEAILSGFAEAQQQTDTKSQLAAETTQHRAEQIGKLPQAEQDFAEASSAVTRSEQHAAHISANAALLSRVGDAVASLTKAEQIERDLDSQLTTCRAAIRSAEEQLKNAEDAAAVSRQLRAERASIAGVFNNVQLRARLFTSFTHSRAEIARLSALLDGRNLDALRAVRTSIATSVSAAAAEVNRLTTELRESDNKAQELASAVLMIAHRLEHDDTTCPVCSSEFEPGILKELAENQAKRESGGLTTLATALADARAKHDGLSRELATADQGISELDQLMRSLAAEQERAASLQQDMITAGGALDQSYGATDISAAQEQLDAIDERLNREPSLDSLDGAVAGARTIVDAARVREAGLEQQRASTRAAVESMRAFLGQQPSIWSADTGLRISLADEQAKARDAQASLGQQIEAERARADRARVTRDAIQEGIATDNGRLTGINDELDALVSQREKLRDRWISLGETGEPDRVRLSQAHSRLAERKLRLEPERSAHAMLVAGLRAWSDDQLLQGQLERLREIGAASGVVDLEEAGIVLNRRVQEAQNSLDLAERTREKMEATGEAMQIHAEEFAANVLKPLNDTIGRFAKTLMTWSDESIIYRAEHTATRSALGSAIVRRAPDGSETQLEMNPNLFFSEGQLSALSVSALLAASTTFDWSRWRGLLLDDPLQHNDVIHASAFMDLLRQMVRELDYQVVLSTHDSAEAEFLVRKCKSAGIPFAVHELLPRGDDGLVSEMAA